MSAAGAGIIYGVSANGPALLAAAAGVGFGHAILPDHWVPLAVLGRTRRYPLGRVARLSGMAGIAHVLVSIILGGAIIAIGLQFRAEVQSAQDTIVGALLVATGIGFVGMELTGRGHAHHDHGATGEDSGCSHQHRLDGSSSARGVRGLAAVMVPFGAAASPDLTILPVFLASATVGVATAVGSLVIFAVVTIATIVALTLAATRGGYQIRGLWLDRWGNRLTASVLIVIGALVLTELI
jgi:hypothetical protein